MKNFLFFLIVFTSVNFAQLMGPKLVLQQNEHDFGNITQGEEVSHNFILTNSGGDLLKIIAVRPSCGCTAALPDKSELEPGESTNLNVKFNSSGRFGKQKKVVKIETNDPGNPQAVVTITGVVVLPNNEKAKFPVINFPETQHDFGQVDEGKVVEYTFNFNNSGTSQLKINDVKTSCGCTAALVSNEVLEPGEKGTIRVELDTSKREGKMSRTVTIKSNDPKDPEKILTLYADIQQ